MDGSSTEHSDSDSGESWTLLENNSVYADEPPVFIEDQPKHGEQHHERDDDTDGISIISDSDHEAPSPPPPPSPHDHVVFAKCQHLQSETEISEHTPINPVLPKTNDDEQDPVESNDFLGDAHAKHKTYVHRRNKRLSTVLNIIVLGSVITAAGVAIGHMWGAKNDCTMPTTSSVNKILSNLYKLQEENAYLRGKLKEFAFLNNNQMQQQKIQFKHNKCRRVFEESLSNNDPRKLTKCVDEKYKNVDNLLEHLVKPKFEKEFVADIDKLKTVYLQNKSWLDDEISRRMKIEEELLKKYNNEVKSAKVQKRDTAGHKNEPGSTYSGNKDHKDNTLDTSVNVEIPVTDNVQKKVTYADSLQSEHTHRPKGDYNVKYKNNDWPASEHNINHIDSIKQASAANEKANYNKEPTSELNSDHIIPDFEELAEENNDNLKEQYIIDDNWTEVKPKFRRNEERYETDFDNSFIVRKTNNYKHQKVNDEDKGDKLKFVNDHYSDDNNNWSTHAQDDKNKSKKEKRNKQNSDSWRNYSDENKGLEDFVNEEYAVKDDRYVTNKLKQEKKRNGYTNSNKKQKRKNKQQKWNTKGEFGEKFEDVDIPPDFVLDYPDKNRIHFDSVSFIKDIDDIENSSGGYKNTREKSEKKDKIGKKIDNVEQANWFEKRASFRTEARKKYYEQFGNTSPNNSSWYFRRMRKREHCRAKGDNSTFRKIYKARKNNMKH